MTLKTAYAKTNAVWPKDIPELTDWEAVRVTAKLWRYAMGESCPYPIEAHGKKHSRLRGGTIKVAYKSGWKDLVHGISHLCYRKANPDAKTHTSFHARLEAKMVKEVLRRGWLTGKLRKAEPMKPTLTHKRVVKLERIDASIKRWEVKRRRAENALKKLSRKRRYYEAALAA